MAQELSLYHGNNPPNVLSLRCRRRAPSGQRVSQLTFASAQAHRRVPQHQQHQSSQQHSRHNATAERERGGRGLWLKGSAIIQARRQNGNAVKLYFCISATSGFVFALLVSKFTPAEHPGGQGFVRALLTKDRQRAEHLREGISAGQQQTIEC